VNIQLDVTFKS